MTRNRSGSTGSSRAPLLCSKAALSLIELCTYHKQNPAAFQTQLPLRFLHIHISRHIINIIIVTHASPATRLSFTTTASWHLFFKPLPSKVSWKDNETSGSDRPWCHHSLGRRRPPHLAPALGLELGHRQRRRPRAAGQMERAHQHRGGACSHSLEKQTECC